MKILHTSDWHLGHQLYKYERDEEFRHALKQIINIVREEQPDAFLISGDVYDTPVPSTSAQNCFTQSLLEIHQACPSMVIIVIAGNHDGKSFLNVSRNLWALAGIHVVGLLSSLNPSDDELQRCTNDVDILEHKFDLGSQIIKIADKGFIVAVPHISDAAYPFLNDTNAPSNIRRKQYFSALLEYVDRLNPQHLPVALMAHLALSSGDFSWHDFGLIGGLATTDQSDFGTQYDYLALGHIHKSQNMTFQGHLARYCGSIIPISFSETAPHTVTIVNLRSGSTTAEDITEITIDPLYSLLTLPSSPLPFDQALQSLTTLSPDLRCYLRLNVLVDIENPMPPDAQLLAQMALKDTNIRFCEIKVNSPKTNVETEDKTISDPSQLREMTPCQVAEYASPEPLSQDFLDMFAEVEQRLNLNNESTNN